MSQRQSFPANRPGTEAGRRLTAFCGWQASRLLFRFCSTKSKGFPKSLADPKARMKRETKRVRFVVIAMLLLCGIVMQTRAATAGLTSSGELLALSQDAPGRAQRTLTFEERVSYQRAIEEVYWRHRIWPKENSNPKPSFDAMMSQAQLEKKVKDYLRNSQALEDYWQRPITTEQLQAELDRIARHTKQPEVLQELFEALGNDPFVIAECLARPALAERLLTSWYAYDHQIHGDLKQRAEAELQMGPSVEEMKQLSGKYTEIELVKSDSVQGKNNHRPEHGLTLDAGEWNKTVQKLGAIFGDRTVAAGVSPAKGRVPAATQKGIGTAKDALISKIKTGVVSILQEDQSRYYATAILNKTHDHLKLAVVSWLKEPLGSWLARRQSQAPPMMAAPASDYSLPKIVEGGCIDDTWTATAGPPDARAGHTSVWTGTEMIVWGGGYIFFFNTGGRYNPSTDSWTATSAVIAPDARTSHTAVWTGTEMIVWGGYGGINSLNTGGTYNPATDSWTQTNTTNAPSPRDSHTSVWTGSEMIIWGGHQPANQLGAGTFFNTGGRYDPSTDSWTETSIANAPEGRASHTAVWTGTEMIVWGGYNPGVLNTGGRYDPNTNSWTATSTANAPEPRSWHTAVWTDMEMIVWSGFSNSNDASGGRYNPSTDSWTATNTADAPDPRERHTAVWTGNRMIVWGGYGEGGGLNTGGTYNPATDSWTQTNTTNAPSPRDSHTSVWTGSEMIVWGGVDESNPSHPLNTGGRYDPSTDSWIGVGPNTPDARQLHTAVWTGTEMIVWGGSGAPFVFIFFNTGGRYNPSTDSWTETNTAGAPDARFVHTAVWTGSEMIIWGGEDQNFIELNSGGRYNPATNGWTPTSTTSAPDARGGHTAVWTGREMIVWGGGTASGVLNTGGIYDPGLNLWTATSTTKVPTARSGHTAVWTGNQMIVWGGSTSASEVISGGRYDPGTNSWIATSIVNAPEARAIHTAVWTGKEMIVWGGRDSFLNDFKTGGRYDPGTDTWTPTSITNVPDARYNHTAVWTDNEMIVWGGSNTESFQDLNTGGRYNPDTDSWTATSTTPLAARELHTAVWTGIEMIVWGGSNSANFYEFNTGGRYCACTGRCGPTPRPRPTPHPRPAPP
jgi:N-acetylneuraminic acid mutarotase